jgi:hypothetical protein
MPLAEIRAFLAAPSVTALEEYERGLLDESAIADGFSAICDGD